MQTVTLGNSDIAIPEMGLGCMGMSDVYGPADETESIATVHRALELGINFFDTADVYGAGHNERLLAKALGARRDEAVIATKCGIVVTDGAISGLCGRPDYITERCERSLERLGTDRIDLYYLHRPDPDTPIEDSVGAMAGLVRAGKVRALGLSEVSGEQLRRAAAVHPISALQSEYSLWWQETAEECGEALRELGISLVPYSPLGRGFLSGKIKSAEDLPEGDFRRSMPRFEVENLERNRAIVDVLNDIGRAHDREASQIALAWVYGRWPGAVPIPGSKRRTHLESNAGALGLRLDEGELARLDAAGAEAIGERYGKRMRAARLGRDD